EEPCNSCENCVAITAGSAADVIEIDGASNRGIDEIRLLRENVTYLPQNSPYKIYIIDEVHMLTTEAFNALLKTLEEPPDHVKFIMATTDVHKMPMTILSRCQRFDFGRLTQAVIAATLVEIGVREKIEFGSGTTELLAREAQGSMRDALSLLDQVRSYAGETILVADLRQALGLIESRHCFSLLENVVRGELGSAVSQINDLEQSGVDLKRFSEEFLFYLRDALFMKLSSKLEKLLGISKDEAALLAPLVGDCTLPYWQQLFDLWQQHFTQIKTSQTPRLALEMALIELGMARDLTPVTELMGRIDQYLKTGPETPFKDSPSRKTEKPALVDRSAAKPVSSSPQPKPQLESQLRSAAPAAPTMQSPPQVPVQSVAVQPAPVQKSQSQPEVSSAPPEMPPEPPAMDEIPLGGSVCEAPMPFL
ncbi:MAG: DNA polymerase III subunit gamma/tau, partial [Deltaproteobacteria bacterium]|nr:DNA polymerase III subunit gamma/tau [Deltaproteobacteria bacterium]